MIFSLDGTLIFSDKSFVVVECGGVGYKCYVSLKTLADMPSKGSRVFVYTHMAVKEDAVDLYGFSTVDELECFKSIITISGVGPRVAVSILSALSPDQISLAVASGDAKLLTTAPGVGNKLAQRIVLELKGKLGTIISSDNNDVAFAANSSSTSNAAEAVSALVSLGYSQSEAAVAVGRSDPNADVADIIKQALKTLAGRA